MPTPLLQNKSPFEVLMDRLPNDNFLRVFGSLCWPNLRPFNAHKLDYHSKPCMFMGYSPKHKGYFYLHFPIGRIFVSRDVTFDENFFPFHDGPHLSSNPNSSLCTSPLIQILSLTQSNLSESLSFLSSHLFNPGPTPIPSPIPYSNSPRLVPIYHDSPEPSNLLPSTSLSYASI